MSTARGWLAVALLTLAAVGVAATSDPKDHEHNYPQAERLYPSPGVAAGSLDDCELDDTCEDFQYPTLDNEDN